VTTSSRIPPNMDVYTQRRLIDENNQNYVLLARNRVQEAYSRYDRGLINADTFIACLRDLGFAGLNPHLESCIRNQSVSFAQLIKLLGAPAEPPSRTQPQTYYPHPSTNLDKAVSRQQYSTACLPSSQGMREMAMASEDYSHSLSSDRQNSEGSYNGTQSARRYSGSDEVSRLVSGLEYDELPVRGLGRVPGKSTLASSQSLVEAIAPKASYVSDRQYLREATIDPYPTRQQTFSSVAYTAAPSPGTSTSIASPHPRDSSAGQSMSTYQILAHAVQDYIVGGILTTAQLIQIITKLGYIVDEPLRRMLDHHDRMQNYTFAQIMHAIQHLSRASGDHVSSQGLGTQQTVRANQSPPPAAVVNKHLNHFRNPITGEVVSPRSDQPHYGFGVSQTSNSTRSSSAAAVAPAEPQQQAILAQYAEADITNGFHPTGPSRPAPVQHEILFNRPSAQVVETYSTRLAAVDGAAAKPDQATAYPTGGFAEVNELVWNQMYSDQPRPRTSARARADRERTTDNWNWSTHAPQENQSIDPNANTRSRPVPPQLQHHLTISGEETDAGRRELMSRHGTGRAAREASWSTHYRGSLHEILP